jgi:mannan endo-1,4-beta-mannosidase
VKLSFRSLARLAVFTLVAAATAVVPAYADTGRDAYVTRSGNHLVLNGHPFTFSGPNMYWLGLDENVNGVGYPTYFRIRDGLLTARRMNSTVVRAHTLGVSTGSPLSLEPALDQFNDGAFATIDYSIAEAGQLGLRLMIPLTDNWQYYHGGRYDFVHWYGLTDVKTFYTDDRVIGAFERYIAHLLDHVNPYTGKRLVDDPTVMAWELGNELNDMPASWIDAISGYLKGLAPRQLVAAGQQGGINPATLTASNVDIVDVHYYPPTASGITSDAATVTAAGKAYVAGEYGSNVATSALLSAVAADKDVSGALFWSLFGHNDQYGYVQHSDGFTLHYPGDTPSMRDAVTAITAYGAAVGTPQGRVPDQPPLITSIVKKYGENIVSWRGSAGATAYRIDRASAGPDGPWTTVSTPTVTDNDAPWLDVTSPVSTVWYRVTALDAAGHPLNAPSVARSGQEQDFLVDPLETWAASTSHSDSLRIQPDGSGAAVAPVSGMDGQLTYAHAGTSAVDIQATSLGTPRLTVQVSADGTAWRTVSPQVVQADSKRYLLRLAGLSNVAAVRIGWPRAGSAGSGNPAVNQVTISYATASPLTGKPSSFALTTPAPNATGVGAGTPIAWAAAAGATYYSLVLSTHADLSDPVATADRLLGTSYQPPARLTLATTYYVNVTAHNAAGQTAVDGSPVAFTTRTLPTSDVPVEDFESYPSDASLQAAYQPNQGGDSITPVLAAGNAGQGMALNYQLSTAGYAGVIHNLPAAQDWTGTQGIKLWLSPDGSGRSFTVQFVADGTYWETSITMSSSTAGWVELPFTSFAVPPWATPGPLGLDTITQLSFYVGGNSGSSTVTVDSLAAYV